MNKKTIFVDLDGTLLNKDRKISERNLDAIKRTKSLGYEIIISTGRGVSNSLEYADQIDSDYLMYSNGNIYDFKNKKIIYENPMCKKELTMLYKSIENEPDIVCTFTCGGVRLFDKVPFTYHEPIVIQEPIIPWLSKNDVVQIIIYGKNTPHLRRIKDSILPGLKTFVLSECSNCMMDPLATVAVGASFSFIGLTSHTSNKGNGIRMFCDMFNIPFENRVSIGDNFNDLPMLEHCAYNVAMGNAIDELKARADYITDTNDNDGVAKFLETLK